MKDKSTVPPPLVVELGVDGKCTKKGKGDIKEFIHTHILQNRKIGRCMWLVTETACGKCDYYSEGDCKA